MKTSIFIEREDKPDYLMVGTMLAGKEQGYTPYININFVINAINSSLDKSEIINHLNQKSLDHVYGEGVVDFNSLIEREVK